MAAMEIHVYLICDLVTGTFVLITRCLKSAKTGNLISVKFRIVFFLIFRTIRDNSNVYLQNYVIWII